MRHIGQTNKQQDDINHLHTTNTNHSLTHEELHEQVNMQEDKISSLHVVTANLSAQFEQTWFNLSLPVQSID